MTAGLERWRRLGVFAGEAARTAPAYTLFRASARHLASENVHRYMPWMLPYARRHLGMTDRSELAYLRLFGQEIFTGRGEIADLGSWMGSTALAVADGLARNTRDAARWRRIHCYDRFVWEEWMDRRYAAEQLPRRWRAGDSFLSEFQFRTRSYGDRIVAHPGDLCECSWIGEPIELLVIDAMKSWDLARAILRSFYRAMLPGGYLYQQDFAHYHTYWIHLIQYRLRDCFTPVYDVPEAAALVYRVIRAPRGAEIADAGDLSRYTRSDVDAAFDYSLSLVARRKRRKIQAARALCLYEYGEVESARAMIEELMIAHGSDADVRQAAALVLKGTYGEQEPDSPRPATP